MTDDQTMEEGSEVSSSYDDTAALSPAAARRRLGKDLRALRVKAGMRLAEMGAALERSTATVSRIELGTSVPRLVDVKAMLDLYGMRVADLVTPETRETMLALVRESRKDDWWIAYRDVLGSDMTSDRLQRFVELETDASESMAYERDLVPGLLQTHAYASAVADLYFPQHGAKEKERFVEFRMRRQQVLDRLQLHVVISGVALSRKLGSTEVMIEQLEALAKELRDGRSNVTIQLAPQSLVLPAAIEGPFVVMRVAGEPDSWLVYLEARGTATYLRGAGEVAKYTAEFRQLSAGALDRDGSLRFIEEVIAGFR